MGALKRLFLVIAVKIVSVVLKKMTPEIRKEVVEFVEKWEVHCKETDNKIDDVACYVVKGILSIKELK